MRTSRKPVMVCGLLNSDSSYWGRRQKRFLVIPAQAGIQILEFDRFLNRKSASELFGLLFFSLFFRLRFRFGFGLFFRLGFGGSRLFSGTASSICRNFRTAAGR